MQTHLQQDRRRVSVGRGLGPHDATRWAVMNRAAPVSGEPGSRLEPDITVRIRSDHDIVTARQHGRALALRLGFTPTDAILVATAISELTRNVLQYAGSGDLRIQRLERNGRTGIAVVVRDQGPGIADVGEAMQNGFSTSGSLGLGLPGVKRLMDEFEIESEVRRGTTVRISKWKR